MGPRLRFAPSPSGSLHVGNARTALINWLVARSTGGTLVLRIEDTDAERSDVANERTFLRDLHWLGVDFDEGPTAGGKHGPYRQSERGDAYRAAIDRLLAAGALYPSFETAEQLAALRKAAKDKGESLTFRGAHRDASASEAAALLRRGGAALRFRVPDRAAVRFTDVLRGDTGLATAEISDFVVARADGAATYNLAVVVDDHDMEIDRVVRGEDHLTNTARQVLLYEALGWQTPEFAHLPLVLGPDRSRLSKRHGATSVAELRERGILPVALCNYLALLGWSPPNGQEVLSMEALLSAFDIADLAAANSVFDVEKLEWLNGRHLALMSGAELVAAAAPFLVGAGVEVPADAAPRAWFDDAIALVAIGKRRLPKFAEPFTAAMYPGDRHLWRSAAALRQDHEAGAVLAAFAAAGRAGELDSEAGYLAAVAAIKESTGAKGKGLFHPLRLALCGQPTGPELKRLVPLIERGAALSLAPPVASVAARINTAMGDAAPDDDAPDDTAMGDAAPDDDAPDDTAMGDAAPDDDAPDDTAMGDAAPDDAAPDDAAPDDAAMGDAPDDDVR